jgi:hypothetical protein
MATITFAQRIAQDLRILVSSPAMVDGTNQRGSGTTEVTAITDRIAVMAAAKVESVLGDCGDYDDAAASTSGDLEALDIGVRLAQVRMSAIYSGVLGEQGRNALKDIEQELLDLAEARRQEASTPVVADVDDDEDED